MNNAVLIQHVYTGLKDDMLPMSNLTRQRHVDYCKKFHMDYRLEIGNMGAKNIIGDWCKVELIRQMLDKGYKSVIWLDVDAVISNLAMDLRDACKDIGVTFDDKNIVNHFNVGVMYFENTPKVKSFIDKWLDAYPWPRLWHGMDWHDQAEFNLLNEENPGIINKLSNQWNSYSGCPCPESDVIVRAFHGMGDVNTRTWMMENYLASRV